MYMYVAAEDLNESRAGQLGHKFTFLAATVFFTSNFGKVVVTRQPMEGHFAPLL